MATKGWSFGALTDALKSAAFLDVGVVSGTVAAGNDSRIVNALQKGNNLSDLTDYAAARNKLSAAYVNGDSNEDFYCRNNGWDTAAVNNQRLNFRLGSKADKNGNQYEGFACTNSGEDNNAVNNVRLNFMISGKADKKGNQYESFSVGGATANSHATRLDQFTSANNGNGGFQLFPGSRGQWCRQNLNIPGKSSLKWDYPYSFPAPPLVLLTCLNGPQNMWIAGSPNSANVTIYNDDAAGRSVNVLAIL